MSLANIKIWVSPVSSRIYAGYINKDGKSVHSKVDVTKQIHNAMMQYLDQTREELESIAGEIHFIPKEADTHG